MDQPGHKKIGELLVRNISRDLVMALEEANMVGAERGYMAAQGMDQGHLPSVIGQLRHFHMNELFHHALAARGASPSPLRGNRIVTGRSGICTVARFNTNYGSWNNGRRSKIRRQMSLANAAIEPLVQPDMFSAYEPPSNTVVFVVAVFRGSLQIRPDYIEIAVPDRYMQGWLFRERFGVFVKRYDLQPVISQADLAVPKLKKHIGEQQNKEGAGS